MFNLVLIVNFERTREDILHSACLDSSFISSFKFHAAIATPAPSLCFAIHGFVPHKLDGVCMSAEIALCLSPIAIQS